MSLPSDLLVPLAQAGGGSGGFGGGGGGGGFGGGGGGAGGAGGSGSPVVALIVVLFFAVLIGVGALATWREKRKRSSRRVLVHAAAAEAAQDDAYLAADAVTKDAGELYLAVQKAWDERDTGRLGQLVGQDLMVEWGRRLADFDKRGWRSRVRVTAAPAIDYVGLVNREDDSEDRVTVYVTAALAAYVDAPGGQRMFRDGQTNELCTVTEYWTLFRRGDAWAVLSIEQSDEGAHNLDEALVATPEADTERIRGQAVTELATADAVPEGFTTADLAVLDFQGSAREEALDLSVADGRFAPDVLEVAARRAVAGWAEAVDGDDAALQAVASPEALQQLLYGADRTGRTRLVLRGPHVRRISIAGVDAGHVPAHMIVEVEVSATRYVEDRDTTDVVSGSKGGPTTFIERFTLALDGPPDAPWRVVGTA